MGNKSNGKKTVTRKDVARLAGVSEMTVTRAISSIGYVSEETRNKIFKAAEELHYIPNNTAASLVRRENSKVVAIILPEFINLYYLQIVDYMSQYLARYNYAVVLRKAVGGDSNNVFREMVASRVSGILNMTFSKIDKKLPEMLGLYDIRSVNMGDPSFIMYIDYAPAIEEIILKAKARNKARTAFITGNIYNSDERISITKRICEEQNMEFILEEKIPSDCSNIDNFNAGYRVMQEFIKSGKTCDLLFCLNDTLAVGAIKAAVENGHRIPEELAVVGFDNIITDLYISPTLTSISADIYEQAKLYADYLRSGIDCVKKVLKTKVFYRESFFR